MSVKEEDKDKDKVELLLFCPSPREIPDFYARFNAITGYDKFFVKYMSPAVRSYRIGREAFLSDERYTHLVMVPDDLLVEQRHVDRMVDNIKLLRRYYGADADTKHCIGGFCNVDTTRYRNLSNIVLNEQVPAKRLGRVYNFSTLEEMRELRASRARYNGYRYGLHNFIEVKFMGFPLMAIPRAVVEEIDFRNDSESGIEFTGCCQDVMFCDAALAKGIKLWVDLGMELRHMKHSDSLQLYWMIGLKEPRFYWEREVRTPEITID